MILHSKYMLIVFTASYIGVLHMIPFKFYSVGIPEIFLNILSFLFHFDFSLIPQGCSESIPPPTEIQQWRGSFQPKKYLLTLNRSYLFSEASISEIALHRYCWLDRKTICCCAQYKHFSCYFMSGIWKMIHILLFICSCICSNRGAYVGLHQKQGWIGRVSLDCLCLCQNLCGYSRVS